MGQFHFEDNHNDNDINFKTNSINITGSDDDDNPSDKFDESELNVRSLGRLIRDMSKYTTLVCIAVFTTFVLVLIVILRVIISAENDILRSIMFTFLLIDTIINNICLTLQFRFANNIYFKYFNICQNRFESSLTNKINQNVAIRAKSVDNVNLNQTSNVFVQRQKTSDGTTQINLTRKDINGSNSSDGLGDENVANGHNISGDGDNALDNGPAIVVDENKTDGKTTPAKNMSLVRVKSVAALG